MKNKIIPFILGLLVGAIITAGACYIYFTNNKPEDDMQRGERPPRMENGEMPPDRHNGKMGESEENKEKETKTTDVEKGTEVTESEIDLSNYDSNITITQGGEYTLSGKFEHAVLVDAESEVTLNLNNVDIKNDKTATIVNISENDLIIELVDGTENNLSDGGSSEYDGCIYSNGNLIINGSGTLNVYGNQEEGEGIATETKDITINGGIINIESEDDGINSGGDGGTITINDGEIFIKASGDGIDSNKNLIINGGNIYTIGSAIGGDAGIDTESGYEINGGTVIALGSDMLEKPKTTSKQASISFNLNNKISKNAIVSLQNDNDEEIISFEAKEDFKTLIISNSNITNGIYYLYENGEKTDFSATVK